MTSTKLLSKGLKKEIVEFSTKRAGRRGSVQGGIEYFASWETHTFLPDKINFNKRRIFYAPID